MRIIDLALKDLRQVLRDRRSLVFLLAMPIVFTFFFGFVFNSQNSSQDNRLPVGIVNHDPDGLLSQTFLDMVGSAQTIRPIFIADADAGQLDSRIVKNELVAGLVIPPGFSAGTLNGENPQMEMIINEETTDGQTMRRALQTTLLRTMSIAQTARFSLKAYEAQAGTQDVAARSAYLTEAVNKAAQSWKSTPLSVMVTNANSTQEKDPLAANPYNQYSPGMIVMFAFFGLMQAAMVLVVERRTGAMARLLTTPMNKAELIGGHILGMFLIFFGQQLLLVLFGQAFLKVNYLSHPLATLLVITALSIWVATTGLLISTLSKKEEQVVLFTMVGMFLFSALGGAWFSLEMVGGAFATVGHLMPSAWAITGYQNIIVRGQGVEAVLLPVGIILAYSLAFFGIAIKKFSYE